MQWVRPDADTLRALDLTSIPAGLDVQVVPTTTPFFDAGGTRYLYSHFKVRNGKGSTPNSDLKNVTFLALDNTTTLGDTAIVSMRNAAGAAITSVDVARSLRPTHRMDTSSVVQALGADLQLFSESEVSAFANSFPWGFGVRHCLDVNCDAYDKTLPGNPSLSQFDGRVTLAFKTPVTTAANTPKSASMLYLVVADNTTNPRVVQSSEEQLTGTVAGRSAVPAGFDLVKLPGSNLPGGTQLSNVRVAGTSSTTTSTLLTRPSLMASNAALQQGQAVTYAVSGSDPQNSTLTYSVSSGTLPAGLTLNANTGAVSGTPSSYGASSVTLRATNTSGEFDEKTVTLSVTATPPNVTVGTQGLTQGQSANFNVTASDPQDLALTYSLAQGSTLPAGLSLNSSTGVVSGTPTVFGTFPVTFQVANSGGGTASKTVTLIINATAPSLTVGDQSLYQSQSGRFTVTATDPQNLALTYGVAQGSTLPAGLTLDSSTGLVSGAPTVFGTFPVTFQVTNSGGASATKTITLTITATPPSVTVGNQTLTQGQSGGFYVTASDPQNLSLTYSVAQGSTLPAGLSLNSSTGVVSGTPTTAGTTSVTFRVANSGGGTATKAITITVNAPPFTAIASPSISRRDHTQTDLGAAYGGKVLIAGGVDSNGTTVASAQLYDPATNTFTTLPDMTVARRDHTATLLSNGRVLITNGTSAGGGRLASAELFNPATSTFTAISATMSVARTNAVSTRLSNGKVLITGGYVSSGFSLSCGTTTSTTTTAELYDPSTNTFTSLNGMTTDRANHTSTLLSNGRVLIAGGTDSYSNRCSWSGSAVSSAEIFDPSSNTFTSIASMSGARNRPTATLLNNGKVLLAGGTNFWNCSGCSSWSSERFDAEIFDPTTQTFVTFLYLQNYRANHTATLLANGKVLLAGGTSGGSSAEVFDPTTNTSSFVGYMNYSRSDHTATLLSGSTSLAGKVLIVGGGSAAELGDIKP
ncbi:kelch-like protein [Deinococcus yavapaiensis]|uniref:kelch-like protein n=1 Tax=Deinococcus yavapaiensis TaxID=309889 RepID=UPI00147404D6|nr:kelch-like protein [Deinococcus yavapaiensis]